MADRRNQKLSRTVLEADLSQLRQRLVLYNQAEAFALVGHFQWNTERRRLESCSPGFARIFGMSVEQALEPQSGLAGIIEQVTVPGGEYNPLIQNDRLLSFLGSAVGRNS